MNMNSIKRCVLIGAVVIGTVGSLPAVADRGGGGYHGGGWHGGGGGGWHGGSWHSDAWWGLGVGLGVGYLASTLASPYYYAPAPAYYYAPAPAPVYYAAPAYAYPATAVIAPPAQVVQSTAVASPGGPAQSFYYCAPTHGYYPNVRSCNVPWQIVPSTPPGATQ